MTSNQNNGQLIMKSKTLDQESIFGEWEETSLANAFQ